MHPTQLRRTLFSARPGRPVFVQFCNSADLWRRNKAARRVVAVRNVREGIQAHLVARKTLLGTYSGMEHDQAVASFEASTSAAFGGSVNLGRHDRFGEQL